MNTDLADWNGAIAIVVSGVGVILAGCRLSLGFPRFLDHKEHTATALGFAFWWVWWVLLAISYVLFIRGGVSDPRALLVLLDAGDLALVGFVIVYSTGNNLKAMRLVPLPLGFAVFVIFYLLHALLTEHSSALSMLALIAPSVVLANIAIFAFGWAFVVRWGIVAVPLLVLCSLYSVCQGPAYTYLFALEPYITGPISHSGISLDALTPEHGEAVVAAIKELVQLEKLTDVFRYLAIGKLVLAVYPMALFVLTNERFPHMEDSRYYPSLVRPYETPWQIKALLKWSAVIVGTALLTELIKHLFWE